MGLATGLQTSQDAKFYALSAKFDEFTNKDKNLVVQFIVKHEQNIDCGGGYVKLFPASLDPEAKHGESPYNLMFGPDICGPGTRKVHVIFAYKGDNKQVPCGGPAPAPALRRSPCRRPPARPPTSLFALTRLLRGAQVKKTIACKYDEASHLYTLIVRPDNTYEVRVCGGGGVAELFVFCFLKGGGRFRWLPANRL